MLRIKKGIYKYVAIGACGREITFCLPAGIGWPLCFSRPNIVHFLAPVAGHIRSNGSEYVCRVESDRMLWYLTLTEAIALSEARVAQLVDEDVRTGALAVQLVKPFSYPLYRLAGNLGERLTRFSANLLVGAVLRILLVGLPVWDWRFLPLAMIAVVLAFVIDFLSQFSIGLGCLLARGYERASPHLQETGYGPWWHASADRIVASGLAVDGQVFAPGREHLSGGEIVCRQQYRDGIGSHCPPVLDCLCTGSGDILCLWHRLETSGGEWRLNGSIAQLSVSVSAYVKFNLKSQSEYKGAFIAQMTAMFLNNCVWVLFWTLFFSRFNVLRGWSAKDVITISGICASAFGIAHAVCGNAWFLPGLIARGELDAWLLYPRRLLSHLILGKMSATAWGDAIFGFAVYFLFVRPHCHHSFLFIGLTLVVAFLFVGFSILTGSLAFFLGNSESLAEQWRFALITFSTYPETLFDGPIKFLLYTLVPAGFVSYLPLKALQGLSWQFTLLTASGALAVLFLGVQVFYAGLRRYESGNLMDMRG